MEQAEAIRSLREYLGISQESLARKLWVTLKTVHRYEHGTPASAESLLELYRLSKASKLASLATYFRNAAGSAATGTGKTALRVNTELALERIREQREANMLYLARATNPEVIRRTTRAVYDQDETITALERLVQMLGGNNDRAH